MTSLNPLEVYADAGRKAAIAVNENDWARADSWRRWLNEACRLESKQWATMARQAYEQAYVQTRRVRR
jgi:hypothetical protein